MLSWRAPRAQASSLLTRPTVCRYEIGNGSTTPYVRESRETLYPWQSYVNGTTGLLPWSPPYSANPDRQVSLAQFMNITQGVYVCANNGNCTAPNLCVCAPGWAGFDCRYELSRVQARSTYCVLSMAALTCALMPS